MDWRRFRTICPAADVAFAPAQPRSTSLRALVQDSHRQSARAADFSRSYTYDELNRIQTLSGTGCSCTGLSWSYDIWGNRTNQTVTGGSCTMSSLSFNTKNQITNAGFGYDAAGNMINERGKSYQYDAENRMTSVNGGSTATYSYGPNGERVRKLAGGAPTYLLRIENVPCRKA